MTTQRRAVYPTAATSLSLARCSIGAQLLFTRLIAAADDQGRLQGDSWVVKAQCMPLVDRATAKAVDLWLAELATQHMILRYEATGQPLVQIVNWWPHQGWLRHLRPSRWPAPKGFEDRTKGHGDGQTADISPQDDGHPSATGPPVDGPDVSGDVDSDLDKDLDVDVEPAADKASPRPTGEPFDLALHKITTTHTDLFQKAPVAKAVKMYGDLLRKQAKGSLDEVLRAMYWCWNNDRSEYGFVKRVKDRLIERVAA